MASNEVQLGGGYASGMFYTAAAGTALPAFPLDSLSSWTEVGDIDADGITFTPRDSETLMHPELQGLFPAGEGAGYAGGIVSAALDGERVAEEVREFVRK